MKKGEVRANEKVVERRKREDRKNGREREG